MRRGTRVGQAYVAVTADGSGINDEIVDSVDDAGDGVAKSGDQHGKDYGDNFGDGLEDRLGPIMEKLGDTLSRRLSRRVGDGIKNSFSDSSANSLGTRIADSIGTAVSDRLEDVVNQQMNLLEDRLNSVSGNGGGTGSGGGGKGAGNNQPNAAQTLYKSYDFATLFEAARVKMHADANKAIETDDRNLLKSQQALYDSVLKMEDSKASFIAKFEMAREKLREQSNAAIFKDDERLYKDQQKLHDALTKDAIKQDAELWKIRRATAAAHQKYLIDLDKGKTDTLGRAVKGGSDSGLGDRIGGLLGGGSRNNALNLFGKSIGGLITSVGKLEGLASSMFSTFQKGWDQAGEGASVFQKTVAGGGAAGTRALSSLAASGPAAVAAIVAVTISMSVMASVASALLAIVVALTSTIVSALAGALLVASAGFAATAAAAGLLTLAFTSMTDAQQALLSDAFQPLKAELTGIGQLMITQMIPYFDTWSTNLQNALALAAPAAAVMGRAFGQAGAALTNSLSGPGFQNFANALTVWLPSITERLSAALGSFLNGLTGTFGALLPLVNRFAGYLAGVAERFSAWANSAEGQNAIVDFAERAVESLLSLWGFVREFVGFIADVLFSPEAQEFGNGMFDNLTQSFENLREKIDSGDLQQWFAEAKEFGEQLWAVLVALVKTFEALNNSGVLEGVALGLSLMASSIEMVNLGLEPMIDLLGVGLTNAALAVTDPLEAITNRITSMGNIVRDFLDLVAKVPGVGDIGGTGTSGGGGSWGADNTGFLSGLNLTDRGDKGNGLGVLAPQSSPFDDFDLDALIASGNAALNATSVGSGGYKQPKKPKKYVNPYVEWANSLIDDGPSGAQLVKQALAKATKTLSKALQEGYKEMSEALRDINESAADVLRSISGADDDKSPTQMALMDLMDSNRDQSAAAGKSIMASARSTAAALRSAADSTVATARTALNSAAAALASASTPKEAAAALAALRAAEKALDAAEKAGKKIGKKAKAIIAAAKKTAAALRKGVEEANKILDYHATVHDSFVQDLVNGRTNTFASLADYAEAREIVAGKLEIANQKLADAIAMRDQFKTAISDSIKAFGALSTTQAKVIDGIEQALTADDIVSNLQTRLDKIKAFQSNLQILLAQGLSDDAYQQILGMGVEAGTPFVDALLEGGQGAISATNDLTGQINDVADSLGLEASNRLYQAGVDAAQGLVDGLTSLSAELDSAAYALGESIAAAVKKALGINSPSRVMIGAMDYVGDGAVVGLDNQSDKVSRAARRFSSNIAVSPEVAAYAASQGKSPVSGNSDDPKFLWTGDIVTPTEDPAAVATEVINEIVGRL